jgi:hypothetical protein
MRSKGEEMKVKTVISIFFVLFFSNIASAQFPNPTPPLNSGTHDSPQQSLDRQRAEELQRKGPRDGIARGAMADGTYAKDINLTRRGKETRVKYNPRLNEQDIRAIEVSPADLQNYGEFLKSPKTGIIRLQNADVCSPNDLVLQASNTCPNNITGKATAFSFRAEAYRLPMFADVFFKGNKFVAKGAFIIGVLSDLGPADINSLDATSDGIKQLLEFQPPENENEIAVQHATLKRGLQVGKYIYKTEIEIKQGNSYVLRSVAYKGKIWRGSGIDKINVLDGDERKDITVAFRILRILNDNSVIFLWKEISRTAPPKIVLEASNNSNKTPKKNEYHR